MSSSITNRTTEAQRLLETLGFDRERTNERAALVLLSLLRLSPDAPWKKATNPPLGTRAIMDWIRDYYEKDYAANSRETIRRFTLHQFAEALLVEQNPDNPDRPVNSPKWCYQIHPRALEVIRTFGQPKHAAILNSYRATVSWPGSSPVHRPVWFLCHASLIVARCGNTSLTSHGRLKCGARIIRRISSTSMVSDSSDHTELLLTDRIKRVQLPVTCTTFADHGVRGLLACDVVSSRSPARRVPRPRRTGWGPRSSIGAVRAPGR